MNTAKLDRLDAATALLRQARQVLDTSDSGLLSAIAALIDCASEAAGAAAASDVDAAREALAFARAAVVAATYASRTMADICRADAHAEGVTHDVGLPISGSPRVSVGESSGCVG